MSIFLIITKKYIIKYYSNNLKKMKSFIKTFLLLNTTIFLPLYGIENKIKNEYLQYLKGEWVIYGSDRINSSVLFNKKTPFSDIITGGVKNWLGKRTKIDSNKIEVIDPPKNYDLYNESRVCYFNNVNVIEIYQLGSSNQRPSEMNWINSLIPRSILFGKQRNKMIGFETDCFETPFDYFIYYEGLIIFNFGTVNFVMRKMNKIPKNFTVQVGVFNDLRNVDSLNSLDICVVERTNGFCTTEKCQLYIYPKKNNEEIQYYIQFGDFEKREEAERLRDVIKGCWIEHVIEKGKDRIYIPITWWHKAFVKKNK